MRYEDEEKEAFYQHEYANPWCKKKEIEKAHAYCEKLEEEMPREERGKILREMDERYFQEVWHKYYRTEKDCNEHERQVAKWYDAELWHHKSKEEREAVFNKIRCLQT